MSSSAGSCSTCCRTDSSTSATTGSWAIATGRKSSSAVASSWAWLCWTRLLLLRNRRIIATDTRRLRDLLYGNAQSVTRGACTSPRFSQPRVDLLRSQTRHENCCRLRTPVSTDSARPGQKKSPVCLCVRSLRSSLPSASRRLSTPPLHLQPVTNTTPGTNSRYDQVLSLQTPTIQYP
jgi:hypothetical protein